MAGNVRSESYSSSDSHVSNSSQSNPPTTPPKKPNPSTDSGVIPSIAELSISDVDSLPTLNSPEDVANLDPIIALRILSRSVQNLSDLTGDVPATPPVISRPSTPGSHSRHVSAPVTISRPGTPPSNIPNDDLHSPGFRRVDMGSPEAEPCEPTATAPPLRPVTPVMSHAERMARIQYQETLARKFYSKKPPAISVTDYLLRLHRYCPMSTAVYLAAGAYIARMALDERSVPVTPRTVHRLLLGALRVAMKALEDLSYPHRRFAGVGGISERELAKLEITVCYLMEFELRVDEARLWRAARNLIGVAEGVGSRGGVGLRGANMRLRLPITGGESIAGRRMTVY